jgi:hypothetical protein
MQPCIGVAVAYALAMHLLLSGIASANMAKIGDAPNEGLFAICHTDWNGLGADFDGNGKAPNPKVPCVLCTLTCAAVAMLPIAHALPLIDTRSLFDLVFWNEALFRTYNSPTGHYQRGPPSALTIFALMPVRKPASFPGIVTRFRAVPAPGYAAAVCVLWVLTFIVGS